MAENTLQSFRLDGKVALVTGCKRGIGYAMAEGLAEAGADIIGVSATLEEEGSKISRAVEALGRKFTACQCDFSDRKALYNFIKSYREKSPSPDILVNNAGTILRAPADEHPDEYWDEVIEVNQTAPFILAREFGREMIKKGGGKIIFTASLLSYQGGIYVPGYAASKGAVQQLVMALSNEWAKHNVQVNAIAPGYISTDNTAPLRQDKERSDAILARIPAGRWGRPDDFKGPTVFLASSASDYMTGATLLVDGGWLAR